jgi:hypothetical protein
MREGVVLRYEHQAGYHRSTIPIYSICQSGFPNILGLDAMNNPQKSILGDTKTLQRISPAWAPCLGLFKKG